jgi:hypothetical protein
VPVQQSKKMRDVRLSEVRSLLAEWRGPVVPEPLDLGVDVEDELIDGEEEWKVLSLKVSHNTRQGQYPRSPMTRR